MKSGTVACAIAATPESTYCSPHAISQNGTAFETTPRTAHCRHAARSSESARRPPSVAARYAKRRPPASSVRPHMSADGDRPPSTATLMKRYDEPQSDARTTSSGQ